ncbi:MAG: N-acetylmuramoyl-L-alanine amidase [Clostridiales bacterium]|jgi:N-acetylmuramoyl-L-alanine amidase|nr:N-acetylmuramoyl-L-alanine amidase [Clostridiales bacterium]
MRRRDIHFLRWLFGFIGLAVVGIIIFVVARFAGRAVPAALTDESPGDSGPAIRTPRPDDPDGLLDYMSGVAYITETKQIVIDRELLGIVSEEFTITEEQGNIYTVSLDMPPMEFNRYRHVGRGGILAYSVDGVAGGISVYADRPVTLEVVFNDSQAAINITTDRDTYDYIVYIDPGHGGIDQGSVRERRDEKAINLDIAFMVRDMLLEEAPEIYPILSRETDVFFDRYERAAQGSELADIFVSIHCNIYDPNDDKADNDITGTEVYYTPGQVLGGTSRARVNSVEMAAIFQKNVVESAGSNDRGVREGDLAVTREATIPSVLIELGYLSNAGERAKLFDAEYQRLLAGGIFNGILETFGID